jgi:hypothetical protein
MDLTHDPSYSTTSAVVVVVLLLFGAITEIRQAAGTHVSSGVTALV